MGVHSPCVGSAVIVSLHVTFKMIRLPATSTATIYVPRYDSMSTRCDLMRVWNFQKPTITWLQDNNKPLSRL
jgi:hypothetical protein